MIKCPHGKDFNDELKIFVCGLCVRLQRQKNLEEYERTAHRCTHGIIDGEIGYCIDCTQYIKKILRDQNELYG